MVSLASSFREFSFCTVFDPALYSGQCSVVYIGLFRVRVVVYIALLLFCIAPLPLPVTPGFGQGCICHCWFCTYIYIGCMFSLLVSVYGPSLVLRAVRLQACLPGGS